jgi:hypothetical protein
LTSFFCVRLSISILYYNKKYYDNRNAMTKGRFARSWLGKGTNQISSTMEAVKQFQGKVWLKTDWIPWPQTLNKLLEKFGAGWNNGPQEPTNPQQPTNPETPVKSVELMTVSDLKTLDITKLWKFGKNGFEFIKIKEQSDKKWKYVEVVVNGKKKRIYELGSNQDGVYYNIEFSEVAWDPFRTVTFGEYKHGKKEWRHTEISTRWKSLSKYVGTFKNDKMLTWVILDDNGREHAVINWKLKD